MLANLELKYFRPSDPFPEEWVLPISLGESEMLNLTMGWMSDQSQGAISFPANIKPETVSSWLANRKRNNRHYLIASSRDGKNLSVVGFAEISFRLTRLHSYTTEVIPSGFPAALHIDEIFVHADYRGNGIGTALLEEAESIGRKNKCKMVTLVYNTRNAAAAKFYYRKKFLQLETQLYGSPIKPRVITNVLAQTITFENLKKHKGITFELKNYVSRDSKSFYPLFSEIDTAVRNIQNNNANIGMQFNGGRDGYVLMKPILHKSLISVYPMLFTPQVWTDSNRLGKYMYYVRQLCGAKYGTEMLHTCTMDLGRVSYLERIGFTPVSEVLRKQI